MPSSSISSLRTRVSAHLSDAAPSEGDVVSVEGWLTFYDEEEKSWKPMKGRLLVFLDGRKIGETEANDVGMFSFSFVAPSVGRHKVEVRFPSSGKFEGSTKVVEFRVITAREKLRVARIARIAAVLLLLLVFVLILSIFASKLLR
ncbi:MAG: hypothetical protein ABWW66_05195 [Archaeoglobaceae archaeon]